jgi:DNA-binding MarR family transcriptional regulator
MDREAAATCGKQCAASNLRKASRAVTALYNASLRPAGLLITQFSILVALSAAGPLPLTRLAKALEMDRTTLTRNAAPLLRQGLTAETHGEDRRNRVLSITEKGRRALERAFPLWKGAQERFTQDLGKERFRNLLSHLDLVRKTAHRE